MLYSRKPREKEMTTLQEIQYLQNRIKQRSVAWNDRKLASEKLKVASDSLCSKLPFKWQIIGAENCFNNHNGSSHGKEHIVLEQDWSQGRIKRKIGDALCKTSAQFKGNLSLEPWEGSYVNCKACLEKAFKIINPD